MKNVFELKMVNLDLKAKPIGKPLNWLVFNLMERIPNGSNLLK